MGLFKRQSYKPSKITGDYIFSNFSYGLYNLDTPRGLGEQLTSLALTGGRNVWTEKGALVSQYGYNIKGEFAEGDVPYLVSSDNSLANNIFILCLNGKVYYYTTLEGLKKYATTLDNIENPVIAHNGNNLYLTTEDTAYIFGGNYSEATPVAMLDRSVTASTQGDIVHFSINAMNTRPYNQTLTISTNGDKIEIVDSNGNDLGTLSINASETKTLDFSFKEMNFVSVALARVTYTELFINSSALAQKIMCPSPRPTEEASSISPLWETKEKFSLPRRSR